MRTYVTVEGEERKYVEYERDKEAEHYSKPLCPKCGIRMTLLYFTHLRSYKHAGVICNFCRHIYITAPGYKTFRATWKKSTTGEVIGIN